MAIPSKIGFDPARLQVQLLNTGLQNKDQTLYQLLFLMINGMEKLKDVTNDAITAVSTTPSEGGGNGNTTIINELGISQLLYGDYGSDEPLLYPPGGSQFSLQNLPPIPPITIYPTNAILNVGILNKFRLNSMVSTDGSGGGGGTTVINNNETINQLFYSDSEALEPPIYPPSGLFTGGNGGSGGGDVGNQPSAQWNLINTFTLTGESQKDFINLGQYSDIRVVIRNCVVSVLSEVRLRVSWDNGATFLGAGEYFGVSGAGVEAAIDHLAFYSTTSTSPRSGEVLIQGFSSNGPKVARSNFFSIDGVHLRIIPQLNPLNAVRIFPSSPATMTGTVYIFGRFTGGSGSGGSGGTGPAGPQGIQGIPGKDGYVIPSYDGIDGYDSFIPGPSGSNGINGKDGINGRDGITLWEFPTDGEDSYIPGPSGQDGIQGITGDIGPLGPQGIMGPPGIDGIPDESSTIMLIDKPELPYVDLVEGTYPSPSPDIARLYSLDVNGYTQVEMKDSLGRGARFASDNIIIAKITEPTGIVRGQAVYIVGAQGANALVRLAKSDNINTMPSIGIVLDVGANNAFTRVLTGGTLQGVNTSAFVEGVSLFVSPTVAGGFTDTIPIAPAYAQRVGFVTRSHATQGEILILTTGVSADPRLHHTTHETGGSDVITSIDGSVITSGSINDARLSGNVAFKTLQNYFSASPQSIYAPQAEIRMLATDQPVDGRLWRIIDAGNLLYLQATDDAISLQQGAVTINRAGTLIAGGGFGTTPLNAASLTGTIPDATLSPNVALTNKANIFTIDQLIRKSLPDLQIQYAGDLSKAHFSTVVPNNFCISHNVKFDGSGWVRDDTTLLSTIVQLVGGTFNVYAIAAGTGYGSPVQILAVDSGGNLSFPGTMLSGTVPDARLSANVALRNSKNFFSDDQFIQKPGASIRMIDTNGAPNSRLWVMGCDQAPDFYFQARDDIGNIVSNSAIFRRSGDCAIGRDLYEKGRAVPMGHYFDYTPTVTANVGTVTLGTIYCCRYMLIGKSLFISFLVDMVTTGGPTVLTVSLPPGYACIGLYQEHIGLANDTPTSVQGSPGSASYYILASYGAGLPFPANMRIAVNGPFNIQ